ncbi:MAG TPA: hypothetical protein VHN77_03190, partial [Phycisphaerales bacterium]|nr:hypothetical protein [Phycisphaerales bacterium]
MPTEELPVLDLVPLMDQLDGPVGEPVREGIERAMPFFDLGMGAWLEVPEASGGGWMWVLDIHLPGAFGVKPHFTNFALPEGAEVLVYDPQIPDNLPSPYRGNGPKGLGDFWGWTCWSDRSRVEVYYPPSVGAQRFDLSFAIDKVAHIYRSPVTGNIGYFNTREFPCHLDRTCYSNWWQVGDSVGRMQFPTTPGFIGNCSGAMLNQTGDLAPFFLTARHCMQDISSRLDNLEVYWFYQSSTCNGAPPSIGSVPRSVGSSYVLTTPVNDMSLVMIDGTVPRNLWWSGTAFIDHVPEDWNIVGIHHPAGTHKRISFGNIWDEFDSCGATNMSQGAEIDWDAGIIEPGSSGSPMFLLDGRVVGVLSCNELPHGCGQDSSYYGRWGSYVSDYPNVMNASAWDDSSENNDS